MLLAVALWVAFAGAALAGPTTTSTTLAGGTTTTTTSIVGSTTTTGTGPTTTTTSTTLAGGTTTTSTTTTLAGGTTTTTTTLAGGTTTTSTSTTLAGGTTTTSTSTTLAGGTTTTTTSTTLAGGTTTTTTSTTLAGGTTTTSTTLPGGGLSGDFPFVDKNTGGANQSFLRIDTSTNEICVAGQVQEVDDTSSLDSTVTFTYSSIGTIAKTTNKKVRGNFGSVLLRLEIAGSSPFDQTITASCPRIEARLLKEGEKDKVHLRCELGENYAAFTGLTSEQIQSIDNAFAKVKRVKARSKTGLLRITNDGVPTAPGGPTCNFSTE